MNISTIILKTTDFLRPVLTKIIPMKILSKAKRKFLNHSVQQLREVEVAAYDEARFPKGINLIGNIKGDSGLGQSCRLLAYALKHSEFPVCIVEHSISSSLSMSDTTYDDCLEKKNKYGVNIFHINPHEFAPAFLQLGRGVWDYHYNIAYWLWEMEDFPDEWMDCINLLDEIWTPAEYISKSIGKKTDKPIVTVPYHVTATTSAEFDRGYFGLPENRFLFLMMFDCGSMIERKNPRAVIEAFKKAFEPEKQDVGLVIKINGGSSEDMEQIESYAAGYNNLYLINKIYSKLEINSLIKCADAVVSLHRAEGFGLVMAEAMMNGVPCIATNWSANTEFMSPEIACMVDYELVELDHDIGPYKRGNRWAEPNVEQAAQYMRILYENPEYRSELAECALKSIEEALSLERIVSIINERMCMICGDKT